MSKPGFTPPALKAGWKRGPTGEIVRDLNPAASTSRPNISSTNPAPKVGGKKGVWESYSGVYTSRTWGRAKVADGSVLGANSTFTTD